MTGTRCLVWGKPRKAVLATLIGMTACISVGPRALAVIGAALIALAGCSSNGGGNIAAQASATPSTDTAHKAAIDLANCMRANGNPSFPDPVLDETHNWVFPDVDQIAPPPACADQAAQFRQGFREHTITAEDMAKYRQYTGCMREHGFPTYPDPDSEGNFPLSPDLRQQEDSPQMRSAEQACVQYLPPKAPK